MSAFGAISQIPRVRGGAALRDLALIVDLSLQTLAAGKVNCETSGSTDCVL
jgi:hypothetical protein